MITSFPQHNQPLKRIDDSGMLKALPVDSSSLNHSSAVVIDG